MQSRCKMENTTSFAEQCAFRTIRGHSATKMKRTTCLVAWACFAVMALCLFQFSLDARQQAPMNYELYSWQNSADGWSFCVLYNTSSEKTVKQVFNKRTELRGTEQLKKRISELLAGASITCVDRLPTGTGPKAKGSEAL